MYRLYSLTVMGTPQTLQIDEALNQAVHGEWIRVTAHSWFVWTDKHKSEIASVALSAQGAEGLVIVVAIQPEQAAGKALPWIWDWLNTRMTKQFQGIL